jgi:hypothetical protein
MPTPALNAPLFVLTACAPAPPTQPLNATAKLIVKIIFP